MFLITRRTRIVAVTILRLNTTVSALDNKFAFLIFCNAFCIFYSIALIIKDFGGSTVSFTMNGPATAFWRDPLIFSHAFHLLSYNLYTDTTYR